MGLGNMSCRKRPNIMRESLLRCSTQTIFIVRLLHFILLNLCSQDDKFQGSWAKISSWDYTNWTTKEAKSFGDSWPYFETCPKSNRRASYKMYFWCVMTPEVITWTWGKLALIEFAHSLSMKIQPCNPETRRSNHNRHNS